MTKKRTQKSKKKGLIGKILFYGIIPIVGALFLFLVLSTENKYLYKEIDLMEGELGALQGRLEERIAEVQKLQSEDRIVNLATVRLGMIRINQPLEELFVSQEKINRIKKIVNSKYE